jgi:hypothetical protein
MVRAVLVFGVEAVNAMFAGMMYGIPAYYAPGKKKDNHASAGTLRAYCQLFVVYTKYVRLSPTEGAAVRYAEAVDFFEDTDERWRACHRPYVGALRGWNNGQD